MTIDLDSSDLPIVSLSLSNINDWLAIEHQLQLDLLSRRGLVDLSPVRSYNDNHYRNSSLMLEVRQLSVNYRGVKGLDGVADSGYDLLMIRSLKPWVGAIHELPLPKVSYLNSATPFVLYRRATSGRIQSQCDR